MTTVFDSQGNAIPLEFAVIREKVNLASQIGSSKGSASIQLPRIGLENREFHLPILPSAIENMSLVKGGSQHSVYKTLRTEMFGMYHNQSLMMLPALVILFGVIINQAFLSALGAIGLAYFYGNYFLHKKRFGSWQNRPLIKLNVAGVNEGPWKSPFDFLKPE